MSPGFLVQHVHRLSRGGGLAIVHREHLKFRSIDLKWAPTTFEVQILQFHLANPLIIANIYQPSSPPPSLFFEELSTLVTKITIESSAKLLVCGDLNCPGSDPEHVDIRLDEVLSGCGLNQLLHEPTRGNNLLDIIATSDTSIISCTGHLVDYDGISDHKLLTVSLNFSMPESPLIKCSFRDLKKLNIPEFESAIRRSSLYTNPATTVDAFSAQLRDVITSELDRLCPVKTINRRAPNKNTKWLSEPAREAKRRRRRLEKKWKRTKLETDRTEYRSACRHAGTLINESRKKFISDEINNCSNSKQRWSKINNILHPKSKTKLQCEINSTTFIQFFHNKIVQLGLSIKSKIISSNITVPSRDPIHSGLEFSNLSTVTPSEVSKLLASIPSKSSNLDYIPTSILKTCSAIFSPLIAKLANLSFIQGQFPSDFKIAQITPLLKKPNLDSTNPANYRPISNFNNISKILERLFLFRFRPFITSSPLFNPYQSAYRQGYSTETALLFTLNNIRQSADRGKSTILVSLDLSSAFDTIDHHLLLERLRLMFGVTGPALNWLKSHLTDRTQLVKQGDDLSIPMLLQTGVPQGSVLGPILFTSFISPVHCIATQFGVHQHQYADDTQLYMEISRDPSDPGISNLESALQSLSSWFLHNGLALNPEKSEAILIGTHARNRTISNTQVNVAGAVIPLSTSLKLLGVHLDNNLNFNKHVNSVAKSCHFHLRALRHIRSTLDLDSAKLIGHALVSSRLDYCNSLLYGAPELSISRLQRVQNALARVVLQKNSATPSAPLLNSLHWLAVHSRISFKIATITYKSLHLQSPNYLASMLRPYMPIRNLRSSNSLLLSSHPSKTNFGSHAFQSAAPIIWNKLPVDIKYAPSTASFKAHLKTHYFQHTS